MRKNAALQYHFWHSSLPFSFLKFFCSPMEIFRQMFCCPKIHSVSGSAAVCDSKWCPIPPTCVIIWMHHKINIFLSFIPLLQEWQHPKPPYKLNNASINIKTRNLEWNKYYGKLVRLRPNHQPFICSIVLWLSIVMRIFPCLTK